jgi:hypothetical protein
MSMDDIIYSGALVLAIVLLSHVAWRGHRLGKTAFFKKWIIRDENPKIFYLQQTILVIFVCLAVLFFIQKIFEVHSTQ